MKITHLQKSARWIVLPVALATMGIAMPSCPGQEAMQQQITTLTTANTDLTKKVQTLSGQVSALTNEMNQVKQILPQVTNLLTSQKTVLDQFDASIKELQAKSAASKPGKKKK